MEKSQISFMSMFLSLTHFYSKYEVIISANPVLNRLFNELFGYYAQMREAALAQEGHTSEASKLKQKEEAEMIDATVLLSARAYVYAVESEQPGLLEKVSVTAWKLRKLSDVKLHTACSAIHEALAGIAPDAISSYGITPEMLSNLQKEIADFYVLISQPRADIITRSQATAKITELIDKSKSLLIDRLDKMVLSLPEASETMKNEYKASRIIIEMKNKKATAEVEVEANK